MLFILVEEEVKIVRMGGSSERGQTHRPPWKKMKKNIRKTDPYHSGDLVVRTGKVVKFVKTDTNG